MTDNYAVIGNPISHSLSPEIHSFFAKQTGQDLYYTRLLAQTENFKFIVRQFQKKGGKGLNVTAPFKRLAFELAQHNSQRAALAQAANTLLISSDGNIIGDNTDGVGLIRDLIRTPSFHPNKKRILIIGVGGAVSGILEELFRQKPQSITFITRTISKAEILAEQFKRIGKISTIPLAEKIDFSNYDLVINATPVNWAEEPLLEPINDSLKTTACYDLNYHPAETSFLVWAKQNGCQTLRNGLGMLIEQAAESFYLWRGIRPDTKAAMAAFG